MTYSMILIVSINVSYFKDVKIFILENKLTLQQDHVVFQSNALFTHLV